MSKFIVQMLDAYTGEVLDTDEEVFDSQEVAQDYADEWGSNFSVGAEELRLRGRDYTPREDVEFVVEEIDD